MHIRRKELLFTKRIAEEVGVGVEIDFVVDEGFIPLLVLLIDEVIEVEVTVEVFDVVLDEVILVVELVILPQIRKRKRKKNKISSTENKREKFSSSILLTSILQQPIESQLEYALKKLNFSKFH